MNKNAFFTFIVLICAGVLLSVTVDLSASRVSAAQTSAIENTSEDTAGDSASNSYLKVGFELEKNESLGTLQIGISDSEVLKNLDKPERKSAAQVWGADGLEHQTWYYLSKGIKFDMVKMKNKLLVNSISVNTPCDFKTKRGIGLGSTSIEVQNAYKKEISLKDGVTDSSLIAGTIYGGIIFHLKDGVVSSIFIGSAAE